MAKRTDVGEMTDDELTDAVAIEVLELTEKQRRHIQRDRAMLDEDRDAFAFQVIRRLGERWDCQVNVSPWHHSTWTAYVRVREESEVSHLYRRIFGCMPSTSTPHRAVSAAALEFVRAVKKEDANDG